VWTDHAKQDSCKQKRAGQAVKHTRGDRDRSECQTAAHPSDHNSDDPTPSMDRGRRDGEAQEHAEETGT
jgi:hypothetical protein